jgi:hypothetical protein
MKKTYTHTSGVTFAYEINEAGSVVGTVTVTEPDRVGAQEYVRVPIEALRAFALVCRYEGWAIVGEVGKGPCMTPVHPRWEKFVELLEGPEGINVHEDDVGRSHWSCTANGPHVHDRTRAILTKHFPDISVEDTLGFFVSNGGYCDCEILMNVDFVWRRAHEMQPIPAVTRIDPSMVDHANKTTRRN